MTSEEKTKIKEVTDAAQPSVVRQKVSKEGLETFDRITKIYNELCTEKQTFALAVLGPDGKCCLNYRISELEKEEDKEKFRKNAWALCCGLFELIDRLGYADDLYRALLMHRLQLFEKSDKQNPVDNPNKNP